MHSLIRPRKLVLLLVLISTFTTANAQWWKVVSKIFSERAAESVGERIARKAAEAAATRASEEAFRKSASDLGKSSISDIFGRGTTSLNHQSDGIIHAQELTRSERQMLDEKLRNATVAERLDLMYMPSEKLRSYINKSTATSYVGIVPGYEFHAAPALKYSQATVTIQKELRKRGYHIQVDGRYGNQTKLAVSKALKNKSLVELTHENAFYITKADLFKNYKSKFIEQRKALSFSVFDFNHNNSLALPDRFNKLNQHSTKQFTQFFDGFYSRFTNKKQALPNAGFITANKIGPDTYLGYHIQMVGQEGLIGRVFNYTKATKKERDAFIKMVFGNPKLKRLHVYGDEIEDINKIMLEKAVDKNVTLITRNTTFNKSFNSTEASLKKLVNKKIEGAKLTFINGTPNSTEEVAFQSLNNDHTELFQNLYTDLNEAIISKNATIITGKEALINELTSGSNDLLVIVAHSDGNNIYFGKTMISLEELHALPTWKDRKEARTAILASCTTGNVFKDAEFINDTKPFAQVLLEKNYFDLIIAPPGNINGNDALQIIDIIDKYPVLKLDNQINQLLENGQMINLAEILNRQQLNPKAQDLVFWK